MCYNNCKYESFNPVTGDCHCHRNSNPCPETLTFCDSCEKEIDEEQVELSTKDCGVALCADCLEWQKADEEINLTCPHCDTEFTIDEDSDEWATCPNCSANVPTGK